MATTDGERATRYLVIALAAGLVTLLLLAVAAGSFLAGRALAGGDVQAGHDDEADAEPDGDATVYYCSMHPEQRSTDPNDTCPICGMALVEMPADVDDEDDRDLPVLRLSERSHRLLELETTPVERRLLEMDVSFVGRLAEDERATRRVAVRADSYVERLHVHYVGQRVEAGEVLAELYSPAVTAAARELLLVAQRDGASLEAARARLTRLGVDDAQIDAIIEAGEPPRTYELRSTAAGTVQELGARQGDRLTDGQALVRVTDLSSLWLNLEAYESDLQWLELGQAARFSIQAQPGRTFEGEVSFIEPTVDERTRTARVRLDVGNEDGRLKPGMFARGAVMVEVAGVAGDDGDAPLVIPRSAPLLTGRRAVVYVKLPATERPSYEGRQVTLGPRAGEHYVVVEGLEEGERVVTRGAFKLDSELQIRGRPSMMARGERFGEPVDETPRVPHDHAAHAVDARDVDASFATWAAEAFEQYLALVAALAEDDLDAARSAVAAYHDHLLAVDVEPLDEAQREAWRALDAELHAALHAMADGDDIEALREHLEHLSDYTALVVSAFAGEHVASAYWLHCPMAFDNRGADWLQADDEVANPYFGASMLRCGEVTGDLLADDADDDAEAPVHDHAGHADGEDDYPLEVCVVSGLSLDAMGGAVSHEHEGREVRFCCAACLPEFEADPERFLATLDEAEGGDD